MFGRACTTVVLVTHFMDEAEHLCDRARCYRAGRVVACDTPAGLIAAHGSGATVTFTTDRDDLGWLAEVEGVTDVSRRGRRVTVTGVGAVLARTAVALAAHGIEPEDLDVACHTLDDVYLRLADGSARVPESDEVG